MSRSSVYRWSVIALAWWFSVGSPPPLLADDTQAGLLQQVDELFTACNRPDVPGCAVGIVQNGELIYSKGFGCAHLEYAAPNTSQTLFEIASASKGFTSACIALLMDDGRLRPDDDVRDILTELQDLEHPVLIRHMLRCESGLWAQFHIMPLAGWPNVPIHSAYEKQDLLTVLAGQRRLPFEPGSDFQYGSSDFFLLGMVIERITGQTLAQFAQERLFEPLGMSRTYYEEDPARVVGQRAVGHWKLDEGWSSQDPPSTSEWRIWQAHGYVTGGGGLRTSVDDLVRWDRAFDGDVLPKGPHLDEFLRDGSVLGNSFVVDADAYKKQEHRDPRNEPIGQYRGLKRFQFTGGFWGMTSCFSRYPQQRFTVICLSNSSEVSAFAKTREIAELFLADQMTPAPQAAGDAAESIEVTSGQLAPLAGAYRQPGNSPVWRVELRDDVLMLVDHLDHATTLVPITPTQFRTLQPSPFYDSARFEFALDAAGIATGFLLSSQEQGFHEKYLHSRVTLVEPAANDLQECAGDYFSPELGVLYRFKVEDDALWLRVNARRWERLRPVVQDEYMPAARDPHDQRFFRFRRDAAGQVEEFSIGFWRVRDVQFDRVTLE